MIMSKWMKQLIEAKTPAPRDVVKDLVVERLRECWQREPYRSAVIPKGLLEAMAESVLEATRLAMEHAQKAQPEIERLREDARKYACDAEVWRARALSAEAGLKMTEAACKPLLAGKDDVSVTAAPLMNSARRGFDLTVQRGGRWDSVRFEPDAALGDVIAGLHALLHRLTRDEPLEKPKLIGDGPARFSVDVDPVSRTLRLRVADEYGDSVSAGIRQGDSSLAGVQYVLMSLHEKIGARRKMLYG